MDESTTEKYQTDLSDISRTAFWSKSIFMNLYKSYKTIITALNHQANTIPPLFLRMILAYEFWGAGVMKYDGSNWFAQLNFPFPFSLVSDDSLWFMATWMELIGAMALLIGIGTRFFSFSLIILTIVAIYSVHWPSDWNSLTELWQGYAITNKGQGNFKLPLLYLIMFLPLLFGGAGRWSLDFLLCQKRKE